MKPHTARRAGPPRCEQLASRYPLHDAYSPRATNGCPRKRNEGHRGPFYPGAGQSQESAEDRSSPQRRCLPSELRDAPHEVADPHRAMELPVDVLSQTQLPVDPSLIPWDRVVRSNSRRGTTEARRQAARTQADRAEAGNHSRRPGGRRCRSWGHRHSVGPRRRTILETARTDSRCTRTRARWSSTEGGQSTDSMGTRTHMANSHRHRLPGVAWGYGYPEGMPKSGRARPFPNRYRPAPSPCCQHSQ